MNKLDDVNYRYSDDKYKDLIYNIFKYELKEKDLHLMGIDNRIMGLKNIVNRYLRHWCNWFDWYEAELDFNKSIKNLADIDDKINLIVEEYEYKKKKIRWELKTKKSRYYFKWT